MKIAKHLKLVSRITAVALLALQLTLPAAFAEDCATVPDDASAYAKSHCSVDGRPINGGSSKPRTASKTQPSLQAEDQKAHAKMVQAMAKVRRQTAAEQRTRRTKAAKRAIAAQPASPVSRDPAITATSNAGLTGTVRPTAQQVAQRLYTHHTSAGQQVVDTASANNVAAAVPTANPEGNVVVVTYVDTPQGGAANGRDQRLGNVTVRVERVGGRNQCDNRKDNPAAKTNAVKTIQDNGKAVLVHGTAHFLGCSAGQYRVTLVGRKNYAPVSSQVKTFTLADDQTEVVPFVLKKQIPAADPAATVQQ